VLEAEGQNAMSRRPRPDAADPEQAMFNRQLATYRKVVRENLMFHREVYAL
jgi:hypothetical protein